MRFSVLTYNVLHSFGAQRPATGEPIHIFWPKNGSGETETRLFEQHRLGKGHPLLQGSRNVGAIQAPPNWFAFAATDGLQMVLPCFTRWLQVVYTHYSGH